MYGQVLSERWLRTFEPIISAEIGVFLQQLSKAGSDPIDMSPLCERLAADIAGQLAFGHPLHTVTEATNRVFPRTMLSMNAVVSLFMSWPRLCALWPLLRCVNRKNNSIFGGTVKKLIHVRQALHPEARKDFYSVLVGLQDGSDTAAAGMNDGTYSAKLQQSELWVEAIFILPAGVTTLGAAMSVVFFYLARHRSVYDRLAAEIRTTFKSAEDIESGPALTVYHYLRAVLDESMRAAPPFLGTFWRELYPDSPGPFVIDGHDIPPSTMVGVNPCCIMRNEKYFPDRSSFRPERWLKPEAKSETGCLGKSMAYQEMSLTIAKTMWFFDFDRAPGEDGKLGEGEAGRTDGRGGVDEYQMYDIATADHKGPILVFKPRLG